MCLAQAQKKMFDRLIVFLKEFFEKVYFEKKSQLMTKKHAKLTLKAPITTAADEKFWDIFPNFQQK